MKNVGERDHHPACVSVFPHQLLNQLVDFHEIWWAGDAIQGDLNVITFNPITSNILKW
jgi:hypothetical protein